MGEPHSLTSQRILLVVFLGSWQILCLDLTPLLPHVLLQSLHSLQEPHSDTGIDWPERS